MEKQRIYRYTWAFLFLFSGVAAGLILNVCMGSVSLPVEEVWSILTGRGGDPVSSRILLDIRMPRTMAVILLGGALALAGYLLQTFFHNPIAGPFVLGISSGAKMAVALVMVVLAGRSVRVTSADMILSAFLGALLSMGFVLLVSRRMAGMSQLVISGVMIGYICSAITELIVTFAEDSDIVNLHNWAQGSFSGITWEQTELIAAVILVTFLITFSLSKPLGAYQLGESYARSMGVNVRTLRVWMVLLSSVLSACIVSFAGPVSFVGIATPHLVKRLFGSSRPLLMTPACFLGGSVFCLFCDLLARNLFAPTELNISTVTAIFGAPVVLWVIAKQRKDRGL